MFPDQQRTCAEALVEAIREGVFAFAKSGQPTDDLTCVAIKVEERQLPLARAEIEIRSDLKELRRAREFVRPVCRDLPAPPLDADSVAAFELAVHEAASNIIKHAYHGRADQWICLEAEAFPSQVSIGLHHLGDPFDPSTVAPPALDGSQESGFGIYLITQSVDDMRYYRDERGRTRMPCKAEGMISRGPPRFVEITGIPDAIASRSTIPNGSSQDGAARISILAKKLVGDTNPTNSTGSPAAFFFSESRYSRSPFPAMSIR